MWTVAGLATAEGLAVGEDFAGAAIWERASAEDAASNVHVNRRTATRLRGTELSMKTLLTRLEPRDGNLPDQGENSTAQHREIPV
jgi:hypothetical protein